jgi:hypothetical protein
MSSSNTLQVSDRLREGVPYSSPLRGDTCRGAEDLPLNSVPAIGDRTG